jgi:drug/metabolite transporter (DMT)-like permease
VRRVPSSGTRAGHTIPPSWQVWSALACVYVLWGSTYLAIRVMVEDVPPLLAAGARFVLAGGVLLAVLAARGGSVRVSRRGLAAAALVGVLLLAGGNGLVTVAERNVPSGLAALLIASVPLWVVVLRSTVGGERVARGTLAGVAVGFSGLALLLLPGSRPTEATAGGVALVLLAAFLWATGTFLSPRVPMPADLLASTAWQMVCGGTLLLACALAAGEPGDLHLAQASPTSLLAFVWLVTAGSLIAFTAFAWLLQNAPVSQVATYAYVNPLVAVALGWALLEETVSAGTIAGTALVVASVATIVSRESPRRTTPSTAAPQRMAESAPASCLAAHTPCVTKRTTLDSVS